MLTITASSSNVQRIVEHRCTENKGKCLECKLVTWNPRVSNKPTTDTRHVNRCKHNRITENSHLPLY